MCNSIWHINGTQCRHEWEQESDLIIIDKCRHLDTLYLTIMVGSTLYRQTPFWFFFCDDDKDVVCFWFLALRGRWALQALHRRWRSPQLHRLWKILLARNVTIQ